MKNSIRLILISSAMFGLLSGCTQPKVYQLSPLVDVDDEVKNKIEERETLNNELSGLSRKGEILDKIHEYQPFIKVLNVYVPGKQLDNGVYEHARVESVPLVFSNNAIRLSPSSVEQAFEDVRQAMGDSTTRPTNAVQTTNTPQDYKLTNRQQAQREPRDRSQTPTNEMIIHKGSDQVRVQSNSPNRIQLKE